MAAWRIKGHFRIKAGKLLELLRTNCQIVTEICGRLMEKVEQSTAATRSITFFINFWWFQHILVIDLVIWCYLVQALDFHMLQPGWVGFSWRPRSAQVALGENGEWQKCLSIFHTATAHDTVGYNACMSACEKSSQWQAALRLFADMLEMKLVDSVPQPFRQSLRFANG